MTSNLIADEYEKFIEKLRQDRLENSEFARATSNRVRARLSVQDETIRDRFRNYLCAQQSIGDQKDRLEAAQHRIKGEQLQVSGKQHVQSLRYLYRVSVKHQLQLVSENSSPK